MKFYGDALTSSVWYQVMPPPQSIPPIRMKLIAGFIALSLCVTWFYNTRQWALTNDDNSITPFAFTGMIEGIRSDHFKAMGEVWKPRIGALWCAAESVKIYQPTTQEQFKDVFGIYNAAWLGLVFTLFIIFLKEPVFVIMATFAGLAYQSMVTTYSPLTTDVHILPWDMPAVFFWAFSFLLWQRKLYWPMVATIIMGTLFKESVALSAVLLFFNQNQRCSKT